VKNRQTDRQTESTTKNNRHGDQYKSMRFAIHCTTEIMRNFTLCQKSLGTMELSRGVCNPHTITALEFILLLFFLYQRERGQTLLVLMTFNEARKIKD